MLSGYFLVILLIYTVGGCDLPYVSIEDGCYFFPDNHFVESFDDAEIACQQYGGHLAMVQNKEVLIGMIGKFLWPRTNADAVLLGAKSNEDGLFEWPNGTLLSESFEAWAPYEPSGDGDCMGFYDGYCFQWSDIPCGNYSESDFFVGFICQQEEEPECPEPLVELSSGCYYVGETSMNFTDAQGFCAEYDSHLVYITSEEEQIAIVNYLVDSDNTDGVWIGAYHPDGDETYYWLDGTPLDDGYTNWYGQNPHGGDQNTARLVYDTYGGQWTDSVDYVILYPLCERDY